MAARTVLLVTVAFQIFPALDAEVAGVADSQRWEAADGNGPDALGTSSTPGLDAPVHADSRRRDTFHRPPAANRSATFAFFRVPIRAPPIS